MFAATLLLLFLPQIPCSDAGSDSEFVILLHGLARTKKSMVKLEKELSAAGYEVLNQGYPSTEKRIQEIAEEVLPRAVETCRKKGAQRIHFVTHSMGGIVVRYYLKHYGIPELGRVVMLSPPNRGSEVVDKLRNNLLFKLINGPAGQQLGTGKDSLPNRLGPVDFELGVITGDRSVNLILSLLIPGSDDGKVSVATARIRGMNDFLVLHATHPFIMKNSEAIEQTIAFLKNGRFTRKEVSR